MPVTGRRDGERWPKSSRECAITQPDKKFLNTVVERAGDDAPLSPILEPEQKAEPRVLPLGPRDHRLPLRLPDRQLRTGRVRRDPEKTQRPPLLDRLEPPGLPRPGRSDRRDRHLQASGATRRRRPPSSPTVHRGHDRSRASSPPAKASASPNRTTTPRSSCAAPAPVSPRSAPSSRSASDQRQRQSVALLRRPAEGQLLLLQRRVGKSPRRRYPHPLDTAFSRDQAHKIYVQHRINETGAEIWKWLEDGAIFYVCGDAERMAKDVDAALHEIVEEHGGKSRGGGRLHGADQERQALPPRRLLKWKGLRGASGSLCSEGKFDPVHAGHLEIAAAAVEACGLGRVVFIPCHQSPRKTGEPAGAEAAGTGWPCSGWPPHRSPGPRFPTTGSGARHRPTRGRRPSGSTASSSREARWPRCSGSWVQGGRLCRPGRDPAARRTPGVYRLPPRRGGSPGSSTRDSGPPGSRSASASSTALRARLEAGQNPGPRSPARSVNTWRARPLPPSAALNGTPESLLGFDRRARPRCARVSLDPGRILPIQ